MSTTRIELDFPVFVDGHEYKELNMRRSKVKDRKAAMKQWDNDAEREIGLMANLCEVSPKVVEELDELDYAKLQKVFSGFFATATRS